MAEERDGLDALLEFNRRRRNGIGATDAPKILMLSKWGGPLSVYTDKVSEEPPKPPSLPAWLGLKLQSTVGELYTTATGTRLRAVNVQSVHPDHPYIVCHLDFRAWGDSRLLVEAKTRASSRGWGPDGSDEVPIEEWVQVQHELMVTGAREAHVAVLFGHREFRVLHVARDEEFIAKLLPREVAFWHDHVLARVPPPAGGSDLDIVKDQNPVEKGPVRPATPEQTAIVMELVGARAARLAAEKAEKAVTARVLQVIGDAAGISGSFGEITWTTNKPTVEHAKVAAAYRTMLAEYDAEQSALDAVVDQHTKPGSRTLRYRLNDEEE